MDAATRTGRIAIELMTAIERALLRITVAVVTNRLYLNK